MSGNVEVSTAGDPLRHLLLTALRISMLPDSDAQNDVDAAAIETAVATLRPHDVWRLAGLGTMLLALTPPDAQNAAMQEALDMDLPVIWKAGPAHERTPRRDAFGRPR